MKQENNVKPTPETTQAILLVADISGYTSFMRRHAIATSHAKQIIVRLLKAIMKASRPPLKVAELEGDAVFFYALAVERNGKTVAREVKEQILDFFSTFKNEAKLLSRIRACDCEACSAVQNLKLKIAIHIGEVAIEQIAQFEKLFGLDVILLHRMLKNSVPSHEYIMMTEPLYRAFGDFYGLKAERYTEVFGEIGEVETLVFYPTLYLNHTQERTETKRLSTYDRLSWMLSVRLRTFLQMIGFWSPKGNFIHLPEKAE
ncbi:MAG: DUF2652 domain-containing protein [Ignavibacteriales bacterium]|nr:DUF2652 domain-containing protein [Ignavibacteriales bacterium]